MRISRVINKNIQVGLFMDTNGNPHTADDTGVGGFLPLFASLNSVFPSLTQIVQHLLLSVTNYSSKISAGTQSFV